jgi:hypothetical protein
MLEKIKIVDSDFFALLFSAARAGRQKLMT